MKIDFAAGVGVVDKQQQEGWVTNLRLEVDTAADRRLYKPIGDILAHVFSRSNRQTNNTAYNLYLHHFYGLRTVRLR